jgi:hypothetical protein
MLGILSNNKNGSIVCLEFFFEGFGFGDQDFDQGFLSFRLKKAF